MDEHKFSRFSWAALLLSGLLLSAMAGYAADRYWQDLMLRNFNARAADVSDLAEQSLVEYETKLKTAFSQYEANRILLSRGGFGQYLGQLRKRDYPGLAALDLVKNPGAAAARGALPFDEEWGLLPAAARSEDRLLLTWHVPLYPLGALPGADIAEAVEARFDLGRLMERVFAKARLGRLKARVFVEGEHAARRYERQPAYSTDTDGEPPAGPLWSETKVPFGAVTLRIFLYDPPSPWAARGPGLAVAALGGLLILLLAWAIRAQHRAALRGQRSRHQHDMARYERAEAIAFIAHELAQPLSGLLGCIEGPLTWLERGEAPQDILRGNLAEAQAHALRACDILDEIRGQVGPGKHAPQAVDLAELVGNLADWAKGEPRLQGVALSLRIEGHGLRVMANPLGLELVFHNLLRNAAEAIRDSGQGGSISLEAKGGAGFAWVRVVDDGPGLAEPAALFTPFRSTKPGGMGLGLVYCQRRVVKDFGGDIGGGNRPEGGAWFAVRLPLLAA